MTTEGFSTPANFKKWLCFENRDFAAIRRGQEWAVERTPNAWLCANTDAGEEWDIHPKDKRTPAHRLALLARGHIYGEKIVCDAPKAAALSGRGNALVIRFDHADDGLVIRPEGDLSALHVVCADGERPFAWEIQKDELTLYLSEPLTTPVSVRYAQDKWFVRTIYNAAGIPALPFELVLSD